MEDKQITLQIDGHFITVPEGSTILEAATKIGINIPTLCHIDLKGTCIKNNPASCRICVVEVIGRRNLAPACATRCTEGMVVKTSTLRVMNARKVVAELILSDHPNDCLTCPKCGNCELQTLALRFNIREMPFIWSLYEKCLRRQYQHCTVCIHCYPGFQSKAGSKILRGPALFYVSIP